MSINTGETFSEIHYALQIHAPRSSGKDVLIHMAATKPFMAFNKGDFINTGNMAPGAHVPGLLRVVSVEHLLGEIEGRHAYHTVFVDTEVAKDTMGTRLGYE
jgi:hypothetical protein